MSERPITLVLSDGWAIPVVIDPACPHEGTVEWNSDSLNRPTTPKRIVLRAWNERVFLHETLHCLLGDNEQLVRRATELYELGWRSPLLTYRRAAVGPSLAPSSDDGDPPPAPLEGASA